jgi:hypothetical protein
MAKNINLTTHQIENLMSLIDSKALVYQYTDELLNVAEKENIAELSGQLTSANEIKTVHKEELQDHDFDELVDWSNDNDILILVNQSLLICIPKVDFEKVA